MVVGGLRPRILVIEDDATDRALLTDLLDRAGCEAITAETAADGQRAAIDERPDLVLLDIELPGTNGFDLCRALRADPATAGLPIVLVTGRGSLGDIVAGIDAGADDFLRKPFDVAEVMARIRSASRLAAAIAEVDGAHAVVASLANAVEAKDAEPHAHAERLAALANRLGTAIDLDPDALRALAFGALLHDVGQVGIREAILTKPGPLTRAEWADLRLHPLIGERLARPFPLSPAFGPIVRNHHERWDGQGYPDGLRGEEIPIGARIVGIVDAFDAMVHRRPYRDARTPERAVAELRRGAGKQFDPILVKVFEGLVGELDAIGNATPEQALRQMRLPG